MAKSRSTRYAEEFSELIENILHKKNINKSFGRIVEMSISDPKKASSTITTLFSKHVDPLIIDSVKANNQLNRIDVLINNWKSEEELREILKKREEERIQSIKDIKLKKKNETLDKSVKYKDMLISNLLELVNSKADSINLSINTNRVKSMILEHPALADHLTDFMTTRDSMTNTISHILKDNLCKKEYHHDMIEAMDDMYKPGTPEESLNRLARLFCMILHDPVYFYEELEGMLLKHGSHKLKELINSFKQLYDDYEAEQNNTNTKRFKIVSFLEYLYVLSPDNTKRLYNHLTKQLMVKNYFETRLRFPNNPEIQSILEADYNYFMLYPETGFFTPDMDNYQDAIEQSQMVTNKLKDECIHPYNPYNVAKVGYLICPQMANLY